VISAGGGAAGDETRAPAEVKELLRGQVVALAPGLEERFGTKIDEEMAVLYGLVTDDGRVVPILREGRGRAFYQDDRLRNQPMDLYVRRFEGNPFAQVLLVYRLRDGDRFALDYWCDVCSISMYWVQPCECCQGPIRLRETPVSRLPDFIQLPKGAEGRTGATGESTGRAAPRRAPSN
jgi:hypothetical protein